MPDHVVYKGYSLLPMPRARRSGAWTIEVRVSIDGDPRASDVIWGPEHTASSRDDAVQAGLAFAKSAIDARVRAH